MQTDRKNAISYDSPNYITRPKLLLLQKNGNTFFSSQQLTHHPIPSVKPIKLVHTDLKFGISKDSPFSGMYTQIHPLTPSIFKNRRPLFQPRASLSNFAKGCTLRQQPQILKKDGLFMRMQSCSSPRDSTVVDSFVYRENIDNLCSNTHPEELNGFRCKLFDYKRSYSSCSQLR